jgi:hypothetical protein
MTSTMQRHHRFRGPRPRKSYRPTFELLEDRRLS